MEPVFIADVVRLADALRAAQGRGVKGKLIADACRRFGKSAQTVYRWLASVGYDDGREERSDKMKTSMTCAEAMVIGGILFRSIRDNGKRTLPVDLALSMARANGLVKSALSDSRVLRLLREYGYHPDQMARATMHSRQRALFPNHTWAMDFSVCVLYRLHSGSLAVMERAEFNERKPRNLARIEDDRILRAVIVDVYSRSLYVDYLPGYETAENMAEALIGCMVQRGDEPFYGVPFQLMLDRGAANTAGMVKMMLEALGIKSVDHLPGNPRANGPAEKMQDVTERRIEGRFAFDSEIHSFADLRARARALTFHQNSQVASSVHGQTPFALWMTIDPATQLREPPDVETLRELLHTVPERRTVKGDYTIKVSHKKHGNLYFDLHDLPGVHQGAEVEVRFNAYRAPELDVRLLTILRDANGEAVARGDLHTFSPQLRDAAGFPLSAAVIGEEFKAVPRSVLDKKKEAMQMRAYHATSMEDVEARRRKKVVPFAGEIDPYADVMNVPSPRYLIRRGASVESEALNEHAVRLLSVADACRRLREILGDAYGPQVYQWVQTRFGEAGVPEEQIAGLAAQFARPDVDAPAQGDRPALRVVAGGGE
jgi:transposase InsO family protein